MKDCIASCVCNDPASLLIPKRSLSACIALLCITFLGVFSAGYFLGKHTAIKELSEQLHNQAFSDQVSQALQTFFNKVPAPALANVEPANGVETDTQMPVISDSIQQSVSESVVEHPGEYHRALLFGGKEADVQGLVNRLQRKGFPVVMRRLVSKNDKGKSIHWYQAVTEPLANRTELLHIVDQIKHHERLSNVQYDSVKI